MTFGVYQATVTFDDAVNTGGYDSEEAIQARTVCEEALNRLRSTEALDEAVERGCDNASEAPVSNEEARQVISLTRVPSVVLGKVLDGGRDGAHAVKLLTIKASKGPGFTLNERYFCSEYGLGRKYGVSRRVFQEGIAHAKRRGALDRKLHGRCLATEKPLDDGSGSFVLIDEALLTRSSSLLAFVLVVNLSPHPMHPANAARRIGVKSAATIRKLTRQAVDAGAIAKSAGSGSTMLVARKGFNFDHVKNDPVKNGPVKNDPAHRGMEARTQKTEGGAQYPEKNLCHSTRSRADRDFQNSFQDEVEALDDPEWIILTPWQNSRGIAERSLCATKPPEVFMSFNQWKTWLNGFGADVPGHLQTPAAHRQALEIANELTSHPAGNFCGHEAMSALAFWVAKACAEGRKIRSLGFIAERILNQLDNSDLSAIHDRPTYKDECEFGEAHQLALEMVAALESHEFPANRARLLSTSRIEGLVDLLAEHGRGAFVGGFNHCMKSNRRPAEGYSVNGWGWFEEDIPASRRTKRRRAA